MSVKTGRGSKDCIPRSETNPIDSIQLLDWLKFTRTDSFRATSMLCTSPVSPDRRCLVADVNIKLRERSAMNNHGRLSRHHETKRPGVRLSWLRYLARDTLYQLVELNLRYEHSPDEYHSFNCTRTISHVDHCMEMTYLSTSR